MGSPGRERRPAGGGKATGDSPRLSRGRGSLAPRPHPARGSPRLHTPNCHSLLMPNKLISAREAAGWLLASGPHHVTVSPPPPLPAPGSHHPAVHPCDVTVPGAPVTEASAPAPRAGEGWRGRRREASPSSYRKLRNL